MALIRVIPKNGVLRLSRDPSCNRSVVSVFCEKPWTFLFSNNLFYKGEKRDLLLEKKICKQVKSRRFSRKEGHLT